MDRPFQIIGAGQSILLVAHARIIAIVVDLGHLRHLQQQRLIWIAALIETTDRQRAERVAVIAALTREDHKALRVAAQQLIGAGELDGRLVCFGAARDEHHPVKITGSEAR